MHVKEQCTLTMKGGSRLRRQRRQLERNRTRNWGGCAPPNTPALVKQQTSLLQTQRQWPARHVRTKRGKPHGNALGGLKNGENEEKIVRLSGSGTACSGMSRAASGPHVLMRLRGAPEFFGGIFPIRSR